MSSLYLNKIGNWKMWISDKGRHPAYPEKNVPCNVKTKSSLTWSSDDFWLLSVIVTVEPRLSGPWLSRLFDYPEFFSLVPIFSWILIICNPFKRLLKQRIILYAFQNSQVRQDKELFPCVQLIFDWLNCFVAKGISCLISSFRVGCVNTRAIDRKLKWKTCPRSVRKRAVLSIKDQQIIISHLDKGEKGTNLAQECDISNQQISDIQKNKDKILKFTSFYWQHRDKSLKLAVRSNWITPCTPGLFNKDLLGHQFQVCFFKRKQNISRLMKRF